MKLPPNARKKNSQHPSRGRERSDIGRRFAQCEAALASIEDGLLVLDKDWRCTYLNEATAALLKTAAEELIGKVIWEVFPTSRYPRLHEEFTRAARQKVSGRFEGFYESLGRWYECACYPTDDGLTVVFHDTTSHKQAEEALRESEQRYRTLFESSRDGIIFTDMEGHVLHTNPYYQEMLGYTPEELRALTYQRLTPPRWHEMEAAVVRDQVLTRGYSDEYEKEYIRRDGTVLPISIRVWLIRDEHGRPQGMWGIVRDITERKRAEEALRRSEERYRRLFDEDLTGNFLATPDGKVVECNPAFAEIYGFADREQAGHCDLSRFNPADWADLMARLRDECSVQGYQCVHRRPDGLEIHVVANVVGRFNEAAELTEVQGYLYDDTERTRAEEALHSAALFPEQNPSPTLRVARDGTLLYANGASAYLLRSWDCRPGQAAPDQIRQYVVQALDSQEITETDVVCDPITYSFSIAPIALEGYANLYARDITARKRAEEALRKSEAGLAHAQRIAHLGNWEWDLSTDEVRWSDEIYRIFGLQPQEFGASYQAFLERVHPDDREIIFQAVDATLHDGAPYSVDHRIILPDGAVRTVTEQAEVVYDVSGTPIKFLGTVLDITERKQAEEALRESEERYHRLFEDDLTGDFVSTPEGKILLCNPAFARIFGFSSADEAVGTSLLALYVDPTEREPLLQRLKQQGIIERLEVWRKRRDGEPIYIVENLVGHFNERGELYEIKGYVFDDTERKRAEEALRESRERLERAQEIAHLGSWELDLVNNRLTWSDEVYRIFGLPPQEFGATYEAFLDHVHPDDRAAVDAAYSGSLREGRDTYEIEHRIVRRSTGDIRIVHEKCEHVRDASGRIIRSVGMVHDITERKQTEEALRELTRTLESKVTQRTAQLERRARQLQKLTLEVSEAEDRERRRIAEVLHDDVQQILAAAKFHLNVLRSRAKYDPSVQATVAQVDHMLKDAIEKSRGLSHELSPAVLHHGDFGQTLRWLAGQVQTKHGLIVHVDAAGEIELKSDALKSFLYKAAQELLFNVVKHARTSEARIRVRRLAGCVCLSVSDQGRGFDPQELRQAAGFGLFSIRERVELLGGRMKIRSAKGHGSKFHVVVPDGEPVTSGGAAKEGPGGRAEGGEFTPGEETPRLRVLVADDHEIVREGLLSLLAEEHTIEVVGEAANGREAVDLAGRLQPDVVVMDVAMPLIDGDEATRQIKKHLPRTRVIALSMYGDDDVIERMRQAGAEAYVLKTAPSEELLAAIRGKR